MTSEAEPSTSRPLYQYIVAATALIVAITGLVGLFIHNSSSGSGSSSPAAKSSDAPAAAPSIPTPVIVSSSKTPYGWVLNGRLDPSTTQNAGLDVVVLAKDQASGSKYVSDTAPVNGDTWVTALSLPATVTNVVFVPGTVAHRNLPAFTGPSAPMLVTTDPTFKSKGAPYHP